MTGSCNQTPQGAETVGVFLKLKPGVRLLVWSLRAWVEGPSGQAAVWSHFSGKLGARDGRAATKAFEHFLMAIAANRSRVIYKHALQCACVSADETSLANLVLAAGEGEIELAYDLACAFCDRIGAAELVSFAGRIAPYLEAIGDAPGLETLAEAIPNPAFPAPRSLH